MDLLYYIGISVNTPGKNQQSHCFNNVPFRSAKLNNPHLNAKCPSAAASQPKGVFAPNYFEMKFLFDLFPVLLFFIAYQSYGYLPAEIIYTVNQLPLLSLTPDKATDAIFLATAVAIVASFLQVGLFWFTHHSFEKMHIVSLGLITLFGGATLVLQDPIFIKWKPTLLNWLFALAFLGTQFIGEQPLIQRMMSHAINVPGQIWRRVNFAWVAYFFLAGLANIYVAYTYSEELWVNFKLFGLMGFTLIFSFAQALYLAHFVEQDDKQLN